MGRKFIISFYFTIAVTNINGSTLFVPDSDTAIMLELLATELQATSATLQILELSSETLEKAQDAHFYVEDKYTKGMQIEQYIYRTQNFSKEMNDLKSMRDVRDKARDGRDIFDDRDIVGLGSVAGKKKSISTFNNKLTKADEINDSSVDKINTEKKLTNKLLKDSYNLETTAQGAVVGAKASALNSSKLDDINQSLVLNNSLLINKQKYEVKKEQEKVFSEFLKMKRWGVIPQKMTLKEYVSIKEKGSSI